MNQDVVLVRWRFVTLLLAALSMGTSFCHFLELPAKQQWDGSLYVAVQNEPPGLYFMFGIVGAVVEVGSVIAAAGLAHLARARQPAFRWTLIGAGLMALALLSWGLFIAPANAVMSAWTPSAVPPDWTRWRDRWEYAHAAGFALKLVGFCALLTSVLIETTVRSPAKASEHGEHRERVTAS